MEVLLVEFRIDASKVGAFDAAIRANAQASRRDEPGCLQFDVCRDPADPTRFVLYEVYTDEAAVQAHLRAPHFLALDRLSRDWTRAKQVQRLRRTEP